MRSSDVRTEPAHEFISHYHDEITSLPHEGNYSATVAMLERKYEVRREDRTHYALGAIALDQQWRYLKHSLAINTVNQPFTLNYRSHASIHSAHKLTIPYSHISQSELYVGSDMVRDHVWALSDKLIDANRVGISTFPVFLDHMESMIAQAKEAGWEIV